MFFFCRNMLPLSGVSSAKRKQSHGHQYQKHHHQHVHLPIAKVGMSNSDKPTSSHLRTPGPSRVMGSTTITRKAATPKAMKFTFTDMLRPGNKIPKVAGLSSRTIPVPLHTDPAIPSRATMDYEQARAALISKRHGFFLSHFLSSILSTYIKFKNFLSRQTSRS